MYSTCVTALIGDDLEAVCKAAAQRWGVPVIPIDSAGFFGSKNLGNRIAGEAMLKYVIGVREPEPSPVDPARPEFRVHDINLIGEYNIAGELWHTCRCSTRMGLRVLCSLSGDARFQEIQTMHRAKVNMVGLFPRHAECCPQAEGTLWRSLVRGQFYGVRDVSAALRDFARLLDDPDLQARTEALIAREEAQLTPNWPHGGNGCAGKRALLYTGGSNPGPIVAALQDLGLRWSPLAPKKSTEKTRSGFGS